MEDRIYCCQTDEIRYCEEIICCRFCQKYNKIITEGTRQDGSKYKVSACYFGCPQAWKKRCKHKGRKGKAETAKLMRKMTLKPPRAILSTTLY